MKSAPTYPGYVNWLWLIPTAIGGMMTTLIMVVIPPDQKLHGMGDFVLKTMPLVMAVVAVALFPRRGRWGLALILLGFIFYMGYVDSVLFLRVSALVREAVESGGDTEASFPAYYMFILFTNAFTVLFVLFAYRLGGGGTANVLKLGLSGILIVISGMNDVSTWLMYPWPGGQRPSVLAWASHVSIFIGRDPTIYHMLGFVAVHLLLVGVITLLPLHHWLDRLKARIKQGNTPGSERA
jgi:hypothetical protein